MRVRIVGATVFGFRVEVCGFLLGGAHGVAGASVAVSKGFVLSRATAVRNRICSNSGYI